MREAVLKGDSTMKNMFTFLVPATLLAATPIAKQAVSTKEAPPAAGPYSQAIKAGGCVFAAGQVGAVRRTSRGDGGLVRRAGRRSRRSVEEVDLAGGEIVDRADDGEAALGDEPLDDLRAVAQLIERSADVGADRGAHQRIGM